MVVRGFWTRPLLAAAVSVSAATPALGIDIRDDRAGTNQDSTNRFSSTGGIRWGAGTADCTMTLVDAHTVLTAAHCVLSGSLYKSQPTLTFDKNGIFSGLVGSGTIAHPNYSAPIADLAIVTFATRNTSLTPVSLATQNPGVGAVVDLAGYGLVGTGTNPSSTDPGQRYFAETAVSAVGGTQIFVVFRNPNTPGSGALPYEGAPARGDSGGPMFLSGTNTEVGAVRGGGDGYGATNDYTSVADYLAFINQYRGLVAASAKAGDGNWTDAAHWTTTTANGAYTLTGLAPNNTPASSAFLMGSVARYYDVTFSNTGKTTIGSGGDIAVDTLHLNNAAAELALEAGGRLAVLVDTAPTNTPGVNYAGIKLSQGKLSVGGELTTAAFTETGGSVNVGAGGVFTLSGVNPLTVSGGRFIDSGTVNASNVTISQTGEFQLGEGAAAGTLSSGVLVIDNGGRLTGSGAVGASAASTATVRSGGVISPVRSGSATPGALAFQGTLTFEAGSELLSRIWAGGVSDSVTAAMGVIQGGRVSLIAAAGTYLPGVSYTLLTGTNGVQGAFTDLAVASGSLPALLATSLSYSPTAVSLQLRANFAKAAVTDTQKDVATALDEAGAGAATGGGGNAALSLAAAYAAPSYGADGAAVFAYLLTNTAATAPNALDGLSGEGVIGQQEAVFQAGGMFMTTVMGQMTFWRDQVQPGEVTGSTRISNGSLALRDAGQDAGRETGQSPDQGLDRGAGQTFASGPGRIWASGFGGTAHDYGAHDYDAGPDVDMSVGGAAGGLDYQIGSGPLLGIAGGYSSARFSAGDRNTSGSAEGAHFGFYGLGRQGPFYLAAAAVYAHQDNTETRVILGWGGPAERAHGEFSSNTLGAAMEAGWKTQVQGVSLTPFVSLHAAQLWNDGFSEQSATWGGAPGLLALRYQPQTATSAPGMIGLQANGTISVGGGAQLRPYVRLGWEHEFRPDRYNTSELIALPVDYTLDWVTPASDSVALNTGFTLDMGPNVVAFCAFDGRFSDGGDSLSGTGGLKVRW